VASPEYATEDPVQQWEMELPWTDAEKLEKHALIYKEALNTVY